MRGYCLDADLSLQLHAACEDVICIADGIEALTIMNTALVWISFDLRSMDLAHWKDAIYEMHLAIADGINAVLRVDSSNEAGDIVVQLFEEFCDLCDSMSVSL